MIVEIILGLTTLILSYVAFNLFRKNETYEDTLEFYENWIEDFSYVIDESSKRIKQIDNRGTFESDDEVGFFFENLKEMQIDLNSMNDRLTGDFKYEETIKTTSEETTQEKK